MKFFGSVAAVVDAVLLTGAQTVAGIKTFTSALVASAGIQLALLWNTNGTGASDVCVKVGTSTADGSVNAGAKLLSVRTGVGATEVEYASLTKSNLALTGSASFSGYPTRTLSCNGSLFHFSALPVRTDSYFTTASSIAFYASGNGFFLAPATAKLAAETAAGASDIAVKVGTQIADGSVNATTKLLSVRTGVGGTEVERAHIVKDGTLELTTAGVGIVLASPDGTRYRLTIANGGAVNVAAA